MIDKLLNNDKLSDTFETHFVEKDLILKPFSNVSADIKYAIGNADHVWLLCRTGLGYWKDFGEELDYLFKKKKSEKNRLLVLDPQGEAFASTRHEWMPWDYNKTQAFDDYQATAKVFLDNLFKQSNEKTIKIFNVILHLVVLIVNANGEDNNSKVMFVEYPSNGVAGMLSHGGYQEKLFLKLTPNEHEDFYQSFYNSFDELWLNATSLNDL